MTVRWHWITPPRRRRVPVRPVPPTSPRGLAGDLLRLFSEALGMRPPQPAVLPARVRTALAAHRAELEAMGRELATTVPELERAVAGLPEGQRKVVDALLGCPIRSEALTYGQAAQRASVHVGTVHRQLHRIRHTQPALYGQLLAVRRWQLAQRHTRVLQRAGEDTVRRRRADRHRRAWLRWYCYRTGLIGCPWVRVNGRYPLTSR